MPQHTYSTVFRDVSFSEVGTALNTIQKIDAISGVDIRAVYDTSGGTLDDGTTYDTEATVTLTYDYSLGDGDVALDNLANALSRLGRLPDKATIQNEIKARG